MASQYTSPGSVVIDEKPGRWLKWVAWGCLGSVVIILVFLGSCFWAVVGATKVSEKEFAPTCAQYIEKFNAMDFHGAYTVMGDEPKMTFPESKHNAVMSGIFNKIGKIKSKNVQFVKTGFDQNGKWGKIVYRAEFEHGSGTIRFELRKSSSEYKIVGVFFESPVLTDYFNQVLSQKP
jgi:hypothetical protein